MIEQLPISLVPKMCLTLVTTWTIAHQAPLSMGFHRQEYWSELLFHSPGSLPKPGIKPACPALQERLRSPSKIYMERQNIEGDKVRGLTILDFKTSCKAAVITTVKLLVKEWTKASLQQNRESRKRLIVLTKKQRQYNGVKTVFSTNHAETSRHSQCKKRKGRK